MEQMGLFFNQAARVFGRVLVKCLVYTLITLLGIILSYVYIKSGLGGMMVSRVKTGVLDFYQVIGHALWGLLPLTLYLVYLFVNDILASSGFGYTPTKSKTYLMIKENAPLIGIGGTMEGVAIGITSMDLGAGVDVAYNSLKLAIGNAVYSSLWGIMIVLFINLVVPMVNPQWRGIYEEQHRRLKSIDGRLDEMVGIVRLFKRLRKRYFHKEEEEEEKA
jgi:hypothetical protein